LRPFATLGDLCGYQGFNRKVRQASPRSAKEYVEVIKLHQYQFEVGKWSLPPLVPTVQLFGLCLKKVSATAFRLVAVAEFTPAFQGRGIIAEPPGVASATPDSVVSRLPGLETLG